VLILLLNVKVKDYDSFRTKANSILSLPPSRGSRKISGFIGFAADWTASFFPLAAPYFRGSIYKPYRRTFKYALRPVFVNLGLDWEPPPISAATVGAIVLLTVIFGGPFIALSAAVAFSSPDDDVWSPIMAIGMITTVLIFLGWLIARGNRPSELGTKNT
jgi:hypothetical protein